MTLQDKLYAGLSKFPDVIKLSAHEVMSKKIDYRTNIESILNVLIADTKSQIITTQSIELQIL